MTPEIRLLGPGDGPLLDRVAPGVFDHAIDPRLLAEFLADDRHHLVVALAEDKVVGFASGVHHVHPDKPAELWINEVAVADAHRGRGVGAAVLRALLAHGRSLGCREAWVLTERSNRAAMRLYGAAGGREAREAAVMFSFPLDDRERDDDAGDRDPDRDRDPD